MRAIQVLLRNAVDYAGLFPPAGLDMGPAVENYAGYRSGASAWALGRFVVPAHRLAEFESAAQRYLPTQADSLAWQLTTLLGGDLDSDLRLISEFNLRHASPGDGIALVDAVEVKAGSIAAAEETMRRIPSHLQAYIEIPIQGDPRDLVAAIARSGHRAKVRTGGVTSEAFPDPSDLIRFMVACIRARIPFKATAGLHHPMRAEYRLTYEADSPHGVMFGFLNLFLAAAFLRAGMDPQRAHQVLEEKSAEALRVEEEAVHWRGHRLNLDDLQRARQETIISFGSCSFTEPLDELQELHLLQSRVQQA